MSDTPISAEEARQALNTPSGNMTVPALRVLELLTERDALSAEVERLRAALGDIADYGGYTSHLAAAALRDGDTQ